MFVQPFRADIEQLPRRSGRRPRVAVLLNGNARKVTGRVRRLMSQAVPENDLYFSRSELDARRIAIEVIERGYETVFLGGGDGTVTCFINELVGQAAAQNTRLPRFGVLKLGTGNAVASLVKASATRAEGYIDDVTRVRDGALTTTRTLELLMVDGKRAPFAGLGLDGQLLNDYNVLKRAFADGPLSPILTGAGGYFASVALKTVPYYLTHSTAVTCTVVNGASTAYRMGANGLPLETYEPGVTLYQGPLMMAAAGTVPFYGFELKMFPFAGTRRGMMHLRLGSVPTTSILANLPKLWSGTWFPDGLRDFLVADATISFDRPMPFQVAGDAAGYRTEVRFELAPQPIELIDFGAALH